ncbi:hypothetical protein ACJIZ3_016832 [Penstemon smallii]|uniref:Uncharacterized protein n=1 Tax=Penstemon smallii TaxID=265156 RepID=A0ABD3SU98_9LAMI
MVSPQSLLMRLESLEAGRKGNLNIATKVFLVAPSFHMRSNDLRLAGIFGESSILKIWTQTVQGAISLPSHFTFFVLEGPAVKFMLTMISFGNSNTRKPDVLIVCWYEISRIRHPIGVSKLYGSHDIFDEMWKADNDPLFEVLIQEVIFLVLLKTKIILQGANDLTAILMFVNKPNSCVTILCLSDDLSELGLAFGKVDPYFGVAARTACVISRATVQKNVTLLICFQNLVIIFDYSLEDYKSTFYFFIFYESIVLSWVIPYFLHVIFESYEKQMYMITKIILQGANDMSSIIMLDQELKVLLWFNFSVR